MEKVKTSRNLLIAAWAIAILGNMATAYITYTLAAIEQGSAVRPMGHAAVIVVSSMMTMSFVITWSIMAIVAAYKHKLVWLLAILAMALALLPFQLSTWIWERIVENNNLIILQ